MPYRTSRKHLGTEVAALSGLLLIFTAALGYFTVPLGLIYSGLAAVGLLMRHEAVAAERSLTSGWQPPAGEHIRDDRASDGPVTVWDLGGVRAIDAPPPPRRHTCYVHTYALRPDGSSYVERCSCGGLCGEPHLNGDGPHRWRHRNSSRMNRR